MFCLEWIFDLMLFDGIFRIYPHVYVFGFLCLCQHVRLFIIVFIFGHINVFHSFQLNLQQQKKRKNSRKNRLHYVRSRFFEKIFYCSHSFTVIFDCLWLAAYCCYIGLFLYFPVHYILAENYPIVTRMIILMEQVNETSLKS
jgi:ABC-type spermidine/putrescine transport system permease subunit I